MGTSIVTPSLYILTGKIAWNGGTVPAGAPLYIIATNRGSGFVNEVLPQNLSFPYSYSFDVRQSGSWSVAAFLDISDDGVISATADFSTQ